MEVKNKMLADSGNDSWSSFIPWLGDFSPVWVNTVMLWRLIPSCDGGAMLESLGSQLVWSCASLPCILGTVAERQGWGCLAVGSPRWVTLVPGKARGFSDNAFSAPALGQSRGPSRWARHPYILYINKSKYLLIFTCIYLYLFTIQGKAKYTRILRKKKPKELLYKILIIIYRSTIISNNILVNNNI